MTRRLTKIASRNVLVALGGNANSVWGNVTVTVQKAILYICDIAKDTPVVSQIYSTPAFPVGSGPDFLNAAIRFQTDMLPDDLLMVLHKIEADAGRKRVKRWGQRTLDLDLIAMDDVVLPDLDVHRYWRDLPIEDQVKLTPDQLILPHPRLQDRSFVLVPLADIAPDWVHPILGQTVLEMRDALPIEEIQSVRPV